MMEEKESESKQQRLLCVGLGVAALIPQDKNGKNSHVFLDSNTYNCYIYLYMYIYILYTVLFLLYFNFQFKEFNDRSNHLA